MEFLNREIEEENGEKFVVKDVLIDFGVNFLSTACVSTFLGHAIGMCTITPENVSKLNLLATRIGGALMSNYISAKVADYTTKEVRLLRNTAKKLRGNNKVKSPEDATEAAVDVAADICEEVE